jgi:short-subunit dehydrogenase
MSDTSFKDKVIIITGASEGIGRSLCLALAPQQPKLVLAARNEDRLHSLKEEVESLGASALVVTTDVTDETSCQRLIDTSVDHWGQIDALINNAGGTMWMTLEEIEELSVYEHLMRLNYLSCVYCTSYALPYLKQSKGLIVGISSVAGLTGVPCRTGYSAAKHAVFGFFDSLRIELMDSGVDVLMVAPDFVQSEIHKRALGKGNQPLGFNPLKQDKIMTSEECADMIIKGMKARERIVITSLRGKLGRWLKLFFPQLIDRIAAKAIKQGQLNQ